MEIRVSQFIRRWVLSCWRSHGKGSTAIRIQLEPWGDEQVAAGWTEMLSFSDLSDRHIQLKLALGRELREDTTIQPSLHVTRSATSSQCRWAWSSCAKPWSYFRVPLTIRSAAFMTRCSLSMTKSLMLWKTSWKHCNIKHENLKTQKLKM